MKRKRRKFSPEEKVAILRSHLLEHVAISDLCDTHRIQPSQFYRWQKAFFERGSEIFEAEKQQKGQSKSEKISALEDKLQRKNEVLAELMEEHVKLKKSLGEI